MLGWLFVPLLTSPLPSLQHQAQVPLTPPISASLQPHPSKVCLRTSEWGGRLGLLSAIRTGGMFLLFAGMPEYDYVVRKLLSFSTEKGDGFLQYLTEQSRQN